MGDDIDLRPVLVTGAAGYLGCRIVAQLEARRVPVAAISRNGLRPCDLTDAIEVEHLLQTMRPSAVIHCAAKVPRSDAEYGDELAARASIHMVANLISARPTHIVFTSSMSVYGPPLPLPVKEAQATTGTGAYAEGKRVAESMLLAAPYSARCTILRLPGLFGPPRRSGLLYNAALAFAKGQTPQVPANPPLWAAMHVEDAAELCVRAVTRRGPSVVINAAYMGSFSIAAAISELAALFGVPAPACPPAPQFEADTSVLNRELGPLVQDFHSRLAQLAAWAREDAWSAQRA